MPLKVMYLHAGPLEVCGDYLSEDLKIAALMAEYAEKDKHYEGAEHISADSSPVEDEGPPRPILMCVSSINHAHAATSIQ